MKVILIKIVILKMRCRKLLLIKIAYIKQNLIQISGMNRMISLQINNRMNVSHTLLEYAWQSMTDQQRFRINLKYEIKVKIETRKSDESKRTIYRAIADKHGYTMKRIEYIDSHKNNIS